MTPICSKCGANAQVMWGILYCGACGHRDRFTPEKDEDVPVRSPLEPLARVHWSRIIEFKGFAFINSKVLDDYEDYMDHCIGDIISVMGRVSGTTIFFELAATVAASRETDHEDGYMLVRIDPDTMFEDIPVLDVNPEDATILGEEEDQGSDEAR